MHLCKVCGSFFENRYLFGSHIYKIHGLKVEEYEVQYNYGGVRPVCKICKKETRFSKLKYKFNDYCVEHAYYSNKEWAQKNGFGAGLDPATNKGRTKEQYEYLQRRSERMKGIGVKQFTREERMEMQRRRLETLRKKKEEDGISDEVYKRMVEKLLSLGLELLTEKKEIYSVESICELRCMKCGRVECRALSSFYYSRSRKRFLQGCSECVMKSITEINWRQKKKKLEDVEKEIVKIREELNLAVLIKPEEYINNKQIVPVVCLGRGREFEKVWSHMSI
ncbi:MAG: hypothetical protein N3A54_00935, partial [Patescibacteria group bacterium]|nr:hypothetical protein [Patescibacteria group bacterium]